MSLQTRARPVPQPGPPRADDWVTLAPDPMEPTRIETIAMTSRAAPVTAGRLCVVHLATGPVPRRVARRGRVLHLRTRSGRFAGDVPADTPHAAAVVLLRPVW